MSCFESCHDAADSVYMLGTWCVRMCQVLVCALVVLYTST